MRKIRLNLASRPLRNMRFYRTCLGVLSSLLVLFAFLAVFFFAKYGLMNRKARIAVKEIEAGTRQAKAEESRFKSQADAAAKSGKEKVDLVNSIIIRKSFSWTEFLSALEGALPDASYITSLAPTYLGENSLALKIKVVSRSLDDCLALINNLRTRNFKKIRVQSESSNERGQLIMEITFDYERTLQPAE